MAEPILTAVNHTLGGDMIVAPAKGAKVGLVSLMYGTGGRHEAVSGVKDSSQLYEASFRLMERYAKKWGYGFWIARHSILEGPQSNFTTGMWSKEALILSIMLDELRKPEGERLEWLL